MVFLCHFQIIFYWLVELLLDCPSRFGYAKKTSTQFNCKLHWNIYQVFYKREKICLSLNYYVILNYDSQTKKNISN